MYLNIADRRFSFYNPIHGSDSVVREAESQLAKETVVVCGWPLVYRWVPDDLKGPSDHAFVRTAFVLDIIISLLMVPIFAFLFELAIGATVRSHRDIQPKVDERSGGPPSNPKP